MVEQAASGSGDLMHGGIERVPVGFGGLGESAHFADKLQRGGRDLLVSRGWAGAAENFDAATHDVDIVARQYIRYSDRTGNQTGLVISCGQVDPICKT